MTLRREVVDLVRRNLPDQPRQRAGVAQIAVVEKQPRPSGMRICVNRVQASGIKGTGAADDAVYFVVFRQQQFGQIRTVLAGDAGNKPFLSGHALPMRFEEFTPYGKSGKRRTGGVFPTKWLNMPRFAYSFKDHVCDVRFCANGGRVPDKFA